jgi:hypothetical protein
MVPLNNQDIGRIGESLSLFILPGSKPANSDNFNHPFDSWTDDGYRVNTKMAKLKIECRKEKGLRKYFSFYLHEWTADNCDFYLLIGYDRTDQGVKPLKAWLIPSAQVKQNYLTIGLSNKGRYAEYVIDNVDFERLLREAEFKQAIKKNE